MNTTLILFAATVIIFLLLRGRADRRRRVHRASDLPTPMKVELSSEPDRPQGFGRKTAWVAVRADSPVDVADTMGLRDPVPANWRTGTMAAYSYQSEYVFVTPSLEGWVLAFGIVLPDPSDPGALQHWRRLLEALSLRYGEAFFFASHRVTSYVAWARYVQGSEVRLFAHADDPIFDLGEPLPEEVELMEALGDSERALTEEDAWDCEGLRFPDEDDVLRFAGLWSFDPSSLDEIELPESRGVAGKWPEGV